MTTTAAKLTATGRYLGTCCWAGHRFVSDEHRTPRTICPTCEPIESEAYGQPWTQVSYIKWTAVKARTSATKCSDVCRSAKSDKCICECGGKHHGETYA